MAAGDEVPEGEPWKPRAPRWVLIPAIAIGVVLVLVQVVGQSGESGGDEAEGCSVEFVVSGTATEALVTYTTSSGASQRTTALPWSRRVIECGVVAVNAQNQTDAGTIRCQIRRDGRTVVQESSSGAFVVVACAD